MCPVKEGKTVRGIAPGDELMLAASEVKRIDHRKPAFSPVHHGHAAGTRILMCRTADCEWREGTDGEAKASQGRGGSIHVSAMLLRGDGAARSSSLITTPVNRCTRQEGHMPVRR